MIKCLFCSAAEMEERYAGLLEEHEDVHQLILGNMIHVKKRIAKGMDIPAHTCFGVICRTGGEAGPEKALPIPKEKQAVNKEQTAKKEQAGEEAGEVLWLFCNFLPYTMVVTPAHPLMPRETVTCAAALASAIREKDLRIAGIQSTDLFAEAFQREYGGSYELELSLDIMTAKTIRAIPPRISIRRAVPADLGEAAAMGTAFVRECLHRETPLEEEREAMRIRLDAEDSIVWFCCLEDNVIGMAASTRKLPHGRSISYVYIRPEFRRNGFCKEMMSAIGLECMAEGCGYLTLYVDRTNPVSNAAYTAVGYEYGPHMVSWIRRESTDEKQE